MVISKTPAFATFTDAAGAMNNNNLGTVQADPPAESKSSQHGSMDSSIPLQQQQQQQAPGETAAAVLRFHSHEIKKEDLAAITRVLLPFLVDGGAVIYVWYHGGHNLAVRAKKTWLGELFDEVKLRGKDFGYGLSLVSVAPAITFDPETYGFILPHISKSVKNIPAGLVRYSPSGLTYFWPLREGSVPSSRRAVSCYDHGWTVDTFTKEVPMEHGGCSSSDSAEGYDRVDTAAYQEKWTGTYPQGTAVMIRQELSYNADFDPEEEDDILERLWLSLEMEMEHMETNGKAGELEAQQTTHPSVWMISFGILFLFLCLVVWLVVLTIGSS